MKWNSKIWIIVLANEISLSTKITITKTEKKILKQKKKWQIYIKIL